VKGEKSMKVLLGVGCFALLLAGCASGAGEFQGGFQWRYHEEYTLSEKNRQALMNLHQGMSLDEVRAMMGEPQMVDQYPSETIWYYRTRPTGLTSGVAGQQDFPDRPGRGADTNFTPLVFDDRQRLVAWGKDVVLP
jgi:outer membrane protein assembly factor BamE (lipoprotein component of BamABCDE complex)